MGSITLGAFASLLTFVTPALPAFLVYRYYYPRSKTLPSGEGVLLIVSALFSWAINGILISKYCERLLTFLPYELKDVTSSQLLTLFKLKMEDCNTLDLFFRFFGVGEPLGDSFWLFTMQLHLRAVVFSVLAIKFFGIFGWLEKAAQLAPYQDKNSCLFWLYSILARLGGGGRDVADPEKYERKRIQFRWLNGFRDAFLDPWARLTLSNSKREILMVDVLMKTDNLYTGFFTSFVHKDGKLSALSMEYAFRYYPADKNDATKSRKKEIIKGNGELIIPAAEMETIHFWEIRKGTTFENYISKIEDGERLKWHILLKHIWPEMIVTVKALFILSLDDAVELHDELETWAAANGLTETFNAVEIGFSEELEKEIEIASPSVSPTSVV